VSKKSRKILKEREQVRKDWFGINPLEKFKDLQPDEAQIHLDYAKWLLGLDLAWDESIALRASYVLTGIGVEVALSGVIFYNFMAAGSGVSAHVQLGSPTFYLVLLIAMSMFVALFSAVLCLISDPSQLPQPMEPTQARMMQEGTPKAEVLRILAWDVVRVILDEEDKILRSLRDEAIDEVSTEIAKEGVFKPFSSWIMQIMRLVHTQKLLSVWEVNDMREEAFRLSAWSFVGAQFLLGTLIFYLLLR